MHILFNILFSLIPLIFYKNTSELFEFNKIITLYIFTILIVTVWVKDSISQKKFIFRRTILDIPLITYLFIYLISSLFSIDPRTSWLGYYSRFNGGLISQVCYILLYWAFVSNLNKKQSQKAIGYMLYAVCIASILAILEHFGIFTTCGLMGFSYYESCWIQDVQNRVFSTLGQPNWLAATITALIPMTWYFAITNNQMPNSKQYTIYNIQYIKILFFLVSILLFVTLLFTKSRSGLLAFGIESIIFWGLVFWQSKFKHLKEFMILFLVFGFMFFVFKTPYSPEIGLESGPSPSNGVEAGGTESGTIRKYVWLGALNIFRNYPILGTGPETFAFAFPKFKPVEHNLTSEWDFLYNKAHNEFLNTLANTGSLGLLSYLFLIGSIFNLFIQKLKITNRLHHDVRKLQITNNLEFSIYNLALMSGFASILTTNFFGFSVVPVSLLFFLFPAFAFVENQSKTEILQHQKIGFREYAFIGIVLLATYNILHTTYYYWQADIHYNKAKNYNKENKTIEATNEIRKALKISPNEPLYIAELSLIDKDVDLATKALDLNPYNQNVRNILISNLNSGSKENQNYLLVAEQIAEIGTQVAPINPKIFYQLAILNLKNNNLEEGIINMEKAVALKPNYKEGRFALGLTYIDSKDYQKAKENLEYILQNIDPNDELTKKYLSELD